jgi:cell division protein FtsB
MGVVYQRDPVRILRRRIIGAVLLVVVVILIKGVWGVYQKEREARQTRDGAELKLSSLEGREAQIRADIAKLKTDRGVEEALREGYELGYEGEGVVVIVEPETVEIEEKPTTLEKMYRSLFSW